MLRKEVVLEHPACIRISPSLTLQWGAGHYDLPVSGWTLWRQRGRLDRDHCGCYPLPKKLRGKEAINELLAIFLRLYEVPYQQLRYGHACWTSLISY